MPPRVWSRHPRPNKYRAVAVVREGIRFGSQKEAARWQVLTLLQQQGSISGLEAHPVFPLVVNGQPIATYIADSKYLQDGRWIIEDVKGYKAGGAYQLFRLKSKLLKALRNVDVQEV